MLLETSVLPKYIGVYLCIELDSLLGKTARYFIKNFFLSDHTMTFNTSLGLDVTALGQKVTMSEITLGLNVTAYETTLKKSQIIGHLHLYCLQTSRPTLSNCRPLSDFA